jgi:hypothetical protein
MTKISYGTVYRCVHCNRVTWLPDSFEAASELGWLIKLKGEDVADQQFLNIYPVVINFLRRMQDISYLQEILPADLLASATAAIVTSADYPFDVPVVEDILP